MVSWTCESEQYLGLRQRKRGHHVEEGDPNSGHSVSKEGYKTEGNRFFNSMFGDRTREKAFKLKNMRFKLDIMKKFLQ